MKINIPNLFNSQEKNFQSSELHYQKLFEVVSKKLEKLSNSKREELQKINVSHDEVKRAILNVMEDLEEAKKTIEEEKAKDEAMLDSLGEGLIALDIKGKVIVINKMTTTLLGIKSKDIIGKKITEIFLEDEAGNQVLEQKQPSYTSLSSGEITKGNYFFIRKDKTKFPVAITATPIKLNGKTLGLIQIIRDITQEKEIDRAKSEFVSLASHQLRTPLGIIKWYLEALENETYFTKAPPTIKEYFNVIYKNNERVLSLVRDLLSVSRIDQGQTKSTLKPIDLIKTVEEIVERMQVVARKKKITLRIDLPKKKIPTIDADALQLEEVIDNLIGNAIKYTNSNGLVDFSISTNEKKVLISVKDNGIGISKSDQRKLFTKFFRTEVAIEHNPEGSGLGLYVVKSYVESWGGEVSVQSSEGKGSTFTISFPLSQKKTKESL